MIDYSILDASIKYYESIGYKRIESPWTVTKAVSDITRPPEAKEFALKHEDNKVLVASGEQSFLYLYLKGFLPPGRFQTVTPCFRSDSFDGLHTKYFMKNELIITDSTSPDMLKIVIGDAKSFFAKYFPREELVVWESASGVFDIGYKDVELGSYGIRQCEYLKWIFGTGCAEPRITMTRRKYGLS